MCEHYLGAFLIFEWLKLYTADYLYNQRGEIRSLGLSKDDHTPAC